MIRDPRDIWVSGYLYHRHCAEKWCTNTDMDPTPPIGWPRVDHSVVHRAEDWKRSYLERLKGKSYQQHLLDRDMQDGLDFERDGYTSWTLDAMRKWNSYEIAAADMKLEAVTANFDGVMLRIFDHFGFTAEQSLAALDVARSEDINRMDEATLALRPQVHSRVISKWSDLLHQAAQVARFEARLRRPDPGKLGYARTGGSRARTCRSRCMRAIRLPRLQDGRLGQSARRGRSARGGPTVRCGG